MATLAHLTWHWSGRPTPQAFFGLFLYHPGWAAAHRQRSRSTTMRMCHHLILVRHGESDHLVNETTGGWSESPLTTRGKTQATYTGQTLAAKRAYDTCGFYSSDLPRAKQTAEGIGSAINVAPVLCPELRELSGGVASNTTLAEAERLRLPVTEPMREWIPYAEAESWG